MDRSTISVYRRVGDDSKGCDLLVGRRSVGLALLSVLLHFRPSPIFRCSRVEGVPAVREGIRQVSSIWERVESETIDSRVVLLLSSLRPEFEES